MPTVQENSIETARAAGDEFFRYAKAVPEDKQDWKPLDAGQSVISMCREIAMTPKWAVEVTNGVEVSKVEREESRARMASWITIDQCLERFNAHFEEWAAMVRTLDDEDLKKTRWLPYNGGRDHTYLELLEYPRWNASYHLGQVAYIQTLYGDKEMY